MDKAELKKIMKPLIKECIKEVLIEIGAQSLVAESVRPIAESKQAAIQPKQIKKEISPKIAEFKKNMLDQIGKSSYINNRFDPFAGTVPLTEAQASGTPMSPILDESDPGVDISSLISTNAASWKAHLNPKGK